MQLTALTNMMIWLAYVVLSARLAGRVARRYRDEIRRGRRTAHSAQRLGAGAHNPHKVEDPLALVGARNAKVRSAEVDCFP